MSSDSHRVTTKSDRLFEKANLLVPGGVNSPVRAFGSVGGKPFIVDHGEGAWLYDVDDNRYVDYVMSWGPLIIGHANPKVLSAVTDQAGRGMSFGAPTRAEIELAALVTERMPWIEKLRLVSSGTEACMTAARIARGATGRDLIVKFDGGYHGHSDMFLVAAGSGMATQALPASGGVPNSVAANTVSLPYNDLDTIEACFKRQGDRIAAVIVEPVAANMGVVAPAFTFLETLRDVTTRHGALLIFDEVITGFRVGPGGAADAFSIRPDLVCLGKILGGGLPVGGVGGRADLMDLLAPIGEIYQAGTLSGNPLSTAAGIATLRQLGDTVVYDHLHQYAIDLTGRLGELFDEAGIPVRINLVESLFTVFFADHDVVDFESAKAADMEKYGSFFRCLLEHGVFLPPSGFEAWFVSAAHRQEHLDQTVESVKAFIAI
jgi:glutamate-1-semialdehyde 2,1-aminomutase